MARYIVAVSALLLGLAVAWPGERAATSPVVLPAGGPLDEARMHGLIEDLADGHNHAGKGRAACAELVTIGERAIPYLGDALGDERKNVRWLVTEALGAIDSGKVVPSLLKAAKDKDEDVRRYAVSFLGKHAAKDDPAVLTALKQALTDSSGGVIFGAVRGLDAAGDAEFKKDEKLVERLIQMLPSAGDDELLSVANALAIIGDAKACEPLVKAIDTPRAAVIIGDALVSLGSKEASKPLLLAMKENPDRSYLRFMGRTLSRLPDAGLTDDLLEMTKSASRYARLGAAEALGVAGNTRALARLTEMLADGTQQEMTRESAAAALGRIGGDQAADALGRALSPRAAEKIDTPVPIRHAAAEALGSTGSSRALEPLVAALKDGNTVLVMVAAQSLGRLGEVKAALPLLAALDRRDALTGPMASADHFYNLATVVNLALKRVTEPETARKLPASTMTRVVTPEDLRRTRAEWMETLEALTLPVSGTGK